MQTNESLLELIINKISSMIGIDHIAMKTNYSHFAGNGAFLSSVMLFAMGSVTTIKERLQLLYVLLAIFSLMIGICFKIYHERQIVKDIMATYGKKVNFKGNFLLKLIVLIIVILMAISIFLLAP